MRTLFLLVSVPLTLVFFSSSQQANRPGPLNLMPMPSYYQRTSDQMAIEQSFSVALTGHQEERLESAVQRFLRDLSRRTGMPLTAQPVDPAQAKLLIHTDQASKEVQEPGYRRPTRWERCTGYRPSCNWLNPRPRVLRFRPSESMTLRVSSGAV
jgi:hypothetical protein